MYLFLGRKSLAVIMKSSKGKATEPFASNAVYWRAVFALSLRWLCGEPRGVYFLNYLEILNKMISNIRESTDTLFRSYFDDKFIFDQVLLGFHLFSVGSDPVPHRQRQSPPGLCNTVVLLNKCFLILMMMTMGVTSGTMMHVHLCTWLMILF